MARCPEEGDECREEQDLDVPGDESLGERWPGEDERPPSRWDGQSTAGKQPHDHQESEPDGAEWYSRCTQQDGHEWQDERRVEERLGGSRIGREGRGQVRFSAVDPALRGPERDLEVDAERVDEDERVERLQEEDAPHREQRGPEEAIRRRPDLEQGCQGTGRSFTSCGTHRTQLYAGDWWRRRPGGPAHL